MYSKLKPLYMLKKWILLLVIPVSLIFVACEGKKAAPAAIPLEVSVVQVVQQDVPLESEYTGQTFGESDIQLNPRVNGLVQSINFKEGTLVKKGQLLYTIDPTPYINKVDQAAGALAEANTSLVKTKADLDMIEPLAKINAVSQRELVSTRAQYEAAQGKVQSAEAAHRNAKIELGYCSITAPIEGLIGISKVRVGDYVSQGPFSTLNTISQLSAVRVRFTISEQEFLRLYREATSENSSLKGTAENITLILSDGEVYPYKGKFSFADRQIDPATGAMTLEAMFSNPDKYLRPGQYVKVKMVTQLYKSALLIPQRAVSEIQGIYQVYTLAENNAVAIKIVKPGKTFADAYIIEDGLTVNEKVIVGGTQFLRPKMTVNPKELSWQPGPGADNSSK